MAMVDGVKERISIDLYDCFYVPEPGSGTPPDPTGTFQSAMTDPGVIRYFSELTNKTLLETNMPTAGQLSSDSTFTVHTMRVVVSGIQFKREDTKEDKIKHAFSAPELMNEFIYNSVTTFIVGEKTMLTDPTFAFPAGGGVHTAFPTVVSHGQPDPKAVFVFAEPVQIAKQQSFRVEIRFPRGVPKRLASLEGPLRIWVMLGGYMMRAVQ
jgi:hypothetical protein